MAFKPRTVKIPLFSGDYQQRVDLIDAELKAARQAAEKAAKSTAARLITEAAPGTTEAARVSALEAERAALTAEAEENGEVTIVTLQALSKDANGVPGRKRWNELVRAHPPRVGDEFPESVREGDKLLGVNDETFGEALLPLSIVEISDPELTPDDLLDEVSSAQWDLLYSAAFALNRGVGSNPKSPHSPPPSLNGDATAASPAASAS